MCWRSCQVTSGESVKRGRTGRPREYEDRRVFSVSVEGETLDQLLELIDADPMHVPLSRVVGLLIEQEVARRRKGRAPGARLRGALGRTGASS
jgi:hypothetical protein